MNWSERVNIDTSVCKIAASQTESVVCFTGADTWQILRHSERRFVDGLTEWTARFSTESTPNGYVALSVSAIVSRYLPWH